MGRSSYVDNLGVVSGHKEAGGKVMDEILSDFNEHGLPIYETKLNQSRVDLLGACLDVLEYEKASFESFFDGEIPADFAYLLNSDSVILSPHVGGWTVESYYKLSDVLADKILEHSFQ